jgi:hypothetical protein
MPPDWKTFDETTAAALRDRIENSGVSVGNLTKPLFADGDTVVIAPTLQKGAALVITARKKATVPAEEPVHYSPLVEEIAEPTAPGTIPVIVDALPTSMDTEPEVALPLTETVDKEPGPTFGPTTWERVGEVETPTEFAELQHETRSIDPEVWDLPSQAAPQPPPVDVTPQENQAPNSDWAEERFVATGFLGLEDYVEDEEEILKAKRPWWKRIFSD